MSKVLDKKYIDSHFRGETWLVMSHLLEQKGVPISTNKIADCTGVDRGNVSSRLCVMRAIGAVTSTVNTENPRQFMWVLNPTIPTRYRKRTKAKVNTNGKTYAEVKAIRAKIQTEAGLERALNAWDADYKAYMNAEPRVIEVPTKPNPTKGKIGVLLELIDAWKIPYAEATEILHILTKRE
ncbi:hypothetical protein UFOVP1295_30 [uncultured Caudovirales phage]|uniref:Uncharacterized protein n=1 Tax=uncultured Caudovirales phage TaxID=2100421 RepID=A0A6J5RPU5_9CAUD|nr:hypothetical protein UFOVP1295_30 [uncultured Caudovirales phage]